MRQGLGRRAVTWGLVVLVLLNACATVPREGTGGSGRTEERGPHPGSLEWDALEDARRAELESALASMWAVASEVREVGAELEFTFWTEGGAFTVLALRRSERGREPGSAVSQESFASDLRDVLPTYVEGAAGELRLTLRREERRWRADFKKDEGQDFPLEAKTWPVQRVGVPTEVLQGLTATGREVASRLWVPAGAQVRWQVEVALDDERVTGLETHPPRSLPGGTSVRAAPELVGTWVNVLVPFTQGLGPRRVRMEWEGTHIAGTGKSHWRIVTAEVVRPPPPAPQNAEVVIEYRAMHERILREWREQTRESFQAAGIFTLEQVALWLVGEWVARGAFLVTEAAAPTVARVLARGGTEAVGWFRSLLARATPAEKQMLRRLMAKAETEGLGALTTTERSEFSAVLSRMDELATVPLSTDAKDELRREARTLFYEKFHPDLAAVLQDAGGKFYDIHHQIPLEYAHLFPLRNINAGENLAAVANPVHRRINNVWLRFRKAPGTPSADEVVRVEQIVRKHFARWFNKVYEDNVKSTEELAAAERAATEAVAALLAQTR